VGFGKYGGQLYLKSRGQKTVSIAAGGFYADRNVEAFSRAVAATLSAVAEVRGDLKLIVEQPASTRAMEAVFIFLASTCIVTAYTVFNGELTTARIVPAACMVLFVAGFLMFRYGPLRRKPEPLTLREVAKYLAELADKNRRPTAT
jgi:hypothetical protein